MSYNIIDLTLFDPVDCAVESYYHRTFAKYQKYKISNIETTDHFIININLIHEDRESNNVNYAEITVKKQCELTFNKLYTSDSFLEKLFKGLDVILGSYYIVELDNTEIILTAKQKGSVPNIVIPSIKIETVVGISFKLDVVQHGSDTNIFVQNNEKNQVHLPITTFGPKYCCPKVGDRLIFIDSVDNKRDRTFTRSVIKTEEHAKCTCDVLYLDQDIDRLETTHKRINGLGLIKPNVNSNNYTANFDKTKVYKRKENYKTILANRGVTTGNCSVPIGNYANMKKVAPNIVKEFIVRSENPHLSSKMNYFGANFHWSDFKTELQPIYNEFGKYLCDHLFLLTSNRSRPEYLVHIDYDHTFTDLPVVGSFTWPVLNCNKDTVTVWYECELDGKKIYEYGKQDVVITNPNIQMKEIDRYYFDTEEWNAVLLKHNDWHTLYNQQDSEENRMLLQWRFKPTVSWEKIKDLTRKLWQN